MTPLRQHSFFEFFLHLTHTSFLKMPQDWPRLLHLGTSVKQNTCSSITVLLGQREKRASTKGWIMYPKSKSKTASRRMQIWSHITASKIRCSINFTHRHSGGWRRPSWCSACRSACLGTTCLQSGSVWRPGLREDWVTSAPVHWSSLKWCYNGLHCRSNLNHAIFYRSSLIRLQIKGTWYDG